MSYILDALKRADAERERGHVPGLHTHNAPPSAATQARINRPAMARVLAAVASAVAVGLAVWWWHTAPEASPAQQQATGTVASADGAAPMQAPPTADVAPANDLVSAAPGVPTPASKAPPAAVLPLLAPPPPAPIAAPPRAEPPRTDASAQQPTPPQAVASNTPAAAPAPAAVRSFAELPAEARAQLPAVNVSGSTYSQNPAHRMLIANGKVVQEGQEIAPGLVLETIGPRSAVLNHRGMRYSIGY
ncbi:general secretion pathway protein GspB [Hydrogenophaga sp.]|uniref:general secretion pathway protein GspB n=1 Tax=Hydrogenophaga sp. TaxID=1904254 RepID=UPI003F6B639E